MGAGDIKMKLGLRIKELRLARKLKQATGKTLLNKKAQSEKIGLLLSGSPARTRTADPVVNSHLLCQLSYWGINTSDAVVNPPAADSAN